MRSREGLILTEVARQVHQDGGEEIILLSVWRDLEAVYRWLGATDLLDSPMAHQGEPSVFDHFEVQHYEVLDPDELAEGAGAVSWAATERPFRPAGLELGA